MYEFGIFSFCFGVAFLILFLLKVNEVKILNTEISYLKYTNKLVKNDINDVKNKKSELIEKYNHLVRSYNKLLNSKSISNTNDFTKDDLKRLKYYIHPDKHNGKTNDLFIKINSMEK